ncbi:MAG: hypothetical protein L0229_23950 [Blastocatellia bacterium]|nr:hypothetical protein [Blastocatellia bacterium]
MGSKIYDFLTESLLFDESLIQEQFSSVSEQDIRTALRDYREFCLSNKDELENEINKDSSNLKVFSGVKSTDVQLLKQSAFYVEQHILYDPLFPLTYEPDQIPETISHYFGFGSQSLDRISLSKVLQYLKALTPAVAANYVKLLPTSYFFEPPKNFPLRFSENHFADAVPKPLLPFFHNNAIVRSITTLDGARIIEPSLYPCREIFIEFEDDFGGDGYGYFLANCELEDTGEEGTFSGYIHLPQTQPDPEYFNAWLFQSINQTAEKVYRKILLENVLASKFRASYLSESEFVFRLLEQFLPHKEGVQTNTANILLNLELPFLEHVDLETLMKIRTDEGEAFQSFRLELDKQLRDLRLIKDSEQVRIKAENILHELGQVQVHQIDRKLKQLKKQGLASAIIIFGGLLGAIQTGGWSLVTTAVALATGYRSFSEYESQVKQNPVFFLWKVLKQNRKN